MVKIADIKLTKSGLKKIQFLRLGIYDLIREVLGFRFVKINNEGYYLKLEDGVYKKCSFLDIKDKVKEYFKFDFNKLEFDIPVEYHEFIEEYYAKGPFKSNNVLKHYLGENFILDEENKHQLLLEIDSKYSSMYYHKKMLDFLKNEGFIEKIDNLGYFAKDCPLFYKKVSNQKYLIFSMPFFKFEKPDLTFDFLK